MKLFLTSSGIPSELQSEFVKFLGREAKGLKAAFIPTAADPEGGQEKSWVQIPQEELRSMGIEVILVDLKNEDESSLREKLGAVDIIYVNGGNTFYLLDWMRKSGFIKVISELLKQGKVYVGVSAGTYVACPTIEHAHWKHADKDVVGLSDLHALNYVPFLIVAHYTDVWEEAVAKGAKESGLTVYALRDGQAIGVNDDKFEFFGGEPRVFKK